MALLFGGVCGGVGMARLCRAGATGWAKALAWLVTLHAGVWKVLRKKKCAV